jgi:hypothetical protein
MKSHRLGRAGRPETWTRSTVDGESSSGVGTIVGVDTEVCRELVVEAVTNSAHRECLMRYLQKVVVGVENDLLPHCDSTKGKRLNRTR